MDTFELRRSAQGRYFFTFRASSGQAIADSIPYKTRRAAERAIDYARRRAATAEVRDCSEEA